MKRKKMFIILIFVIISFYLGRQIYWFIEFNGNTIIYISNQSAKIDTVCIEAYLDGKRVIVKNFDNKSFHNYKRFPLKTSFGKHTFLVKAKILGLSQEISFRTLLVKWIVVDFFEKDVLPPGEKNKYTFLITTQSGPLTIE
jgi:hypothetical protein